MTPDLRYWNRHEPTINGDEWLAILYAHDCMPDPTHGTFYEPIEDEE